mgnify:CR=1 FL=1
MILKEPLSEEEQNRLFKLRHNPDVREKLILHNLRLVYWVAEKYYVPGRNEMDDLFQAGVLGLMKAIDKYEPDRGAKFSTVAVWYIQNAIKRNMFVFSDDEPLDKELPGSDGITVADAIPSDDPSPDEAAADSLFAYHFEQIFGPILTELEYKVVVLHYGIGCQECNLKSIARKLNKPFVQVRGISQNALNKVRRNIYRLGIEYEVDKETIFYKSIDYTCPKSKGGEIISPIEKIVLERELIRKRLQEQYFNYAAVNE